ncbi:flagellar hook-associated protein FlgK [Paracoccus xiamenensis]|uniref:flagellar hook-associated protein FlgK n=1 Tax=Paracoccus xiamenensis TaxID=2714901 RepID=UPI00140A1C7A|nr:flagellar hook-associated protein FlgK [Paracoccus xiamenensis]NHF72907.1 flagellar hook-associated protein FlgK [Paracoccus xiamenensis]
MSIVNALNNAISGLTAAARGTEVVASNLANALTPGYGRRELELSSRTLSGNGGGVHINAVNRIVSDAVLGEFRLASSGLARSSVSHGFYKSIEAAIGLPQDSGSLSVKMTGLENALISAASRPDSEVRLRGVFDAADQLTAKLRSISDTIQDNRTDADRKIGLQVNALNNDLSEVARLNKQIIVEGANGRSTASLVDARQAVIDRISSIVPVREMPRENGRVALFTTGGAVLLDSMTPTTFGFQPTGRLVPDIDGNSAVLGRLTIDGEPASSAQMDLLRGGSLSELHKVRDEYGVTAQASLDAIARELHDRFADATVDGTLPSGVSGLFTDGLNNFDPANERGLSSRLRVNSAVDPSQGGALWRIRDGIQANVPGDIGSSNLIDGLADAMGAIRQYHSANATNTAGNLGNLVAGVLSDVSATRLTFEANKSRDATLQSSLQSALFTDAVDSDREMEMLLQLEKSYAANAKVIQAVDKMLDNILRI